MQQHLSVGTLMSEKNISGSSIIYYIKILCFVYIPDKFQK